MKIFISQLMNGKSKEEIFQERNRIINLLKEKYKDIEILDSYINEDCNDCKYPAIFYLAKSLEIMSKADLCFFSKNFEKGRGCMFEYSIASIYGINIEIE